MRNLLSSGSGLAQQQASVLGSGTDVNQLGSATAAMLPYLIPNLAAYYDFTDSSKLTADASNRVSFARDISGNSGTLGLVNGAANTSNQAAIAGISAFGTSNFTVVADCMISALGASMAITGGAASGFQLAIDATGHPMSGSANVGNNTAATGTISALARTTVAYTRSGTTGIYYINGVSAGTISDSRDYSGSGNLVLNSFGVGAGSIWIGTVFAVRTYSVALDATGVAADYAGTVQANNVLNLSFAGFTYGGSSGTAATGQAVTITSSGALGARIAGARDLAMLTGSAQPLLLPWSGSSYLYMPAASGNYASFSALSAFGTGDFTVVVKFRTTSVAADQAIIGSQNNGFTLRVNSSGRLQASLAGVADITQDTTALSANTDYWAAYVRSGGTTGAYYVNAVAASTPPDAKNYTTGILQFGQTDTAATRFFGGNVYFGRVYSAALNGTQLTADYNGTVQSNCVFDCDFTQQVNNAASFTSGTRGGATGITVTVNSAGSKPAQVVGKQSVLFASYYMATAAFTLNQPETIYLVGKQNVWTLNNYIYDGASGFDSMSLQQVGTTPNVQVYAGAGGVNNAGWAVGANVVHTSVFNTANSSNRVNRGTAATGQAWTGNGGGLTLGAKQNGAAGASVQVMYALIFAAAHDTATQDRIIQYLGRQAGITV